MHQELGWSVIGSRFVGRLLIGLAGFRLVCEAHWSLLLWLAPHLFPLPIESWSAFINQTLNLDDSRMAVGVDSH